MAVNFYMYPGFHPLQLPPRRRQHFCIIRIQIMYYFLPSTSKLLNKNNFTWMSHVEIHSDR